jgi:N-acetylglucosamine kinase-like BadF-type ATPase
MMSSLPQTPRYFLGVDIGSTKSHALIADEVGKTVGFGLAGPGNHEVVDYEGLIAALQSITCQALETSRLPKEASAGAGFGVSGYDWPSELAPTLQAVSTLGLSCPVRAVNDTVIGLIAGSVEGWGVAVVAGTGSNCWGRDCHGREGRMTGCSTRFAENGGAGEVVMRAIHRFPWPGRAAAPKPAFLRRLWSESALDLWTSYWKVWSWIGTRSTRAPLHWCSRSPEKEIQSPER